jgi:hypothetical protein
MKFIKKDSAALAMATAKVQDNMNPFEAMPAMTISSSSTNVS